MPDQRAELVRKMIAEGTSDDDIRATLKVYDAKQSAAPPANKRPLLMGNSDAGAAKQFADPSAMRDLNAAKDTMANVGLAVGAMGLGGALAPASVTNGATALAKSAGQLGLYGGAYKGLTAMGVPPEYAALLLGAAGLKNWRNGGGTQSAQEPVPSRNAGGRLLTTKAPGVEQQLADAIAELRGAQTQQPSGVSLPPPPRLPAGYTPRSTAPPLALEPAPQPSPNAGGRLVGGVKAPSIERQLADALAELQQPSRPNSVSLPPQPQLPPGYTPRSSAPVRIVGAKAAPEAAAPKPASLPARSQVQRNVSVIREPGDMPKSWHAFLNPEARGSAPAESRQGISALHRELNDMDASYRAATAGERAALQAVPLDFKEALVALLRGGGPPR